MERTLYNLCWDLLCVTPKTDLKMKSISRAKERERLRERELECKENRIIIQTLSKSNTHPGKIPRKNACHYENYDNCKGL